MEFLRKHFKNSDPCASRMRMRDRKATEQSILDAASRLFAEKGYENTRTLEIAKEAFANEALITRYFGGKEGLLAAVLAKNSSNEKPTDPAVYAGPCKSGMEDFPVLEDRDLEKAIGMFFAKGKDFTKENEAFMRIATARALVDSDMADMVRNKIIEEKTAHMGKRLKTYLNGKHSPEEIEAAAILLSSTNFWMNFMGRRVYRINSKKIDHVFELLGKMMDHYFCDDGKQE